jgi:uncharacterized protein (TIGR03086 family)
MAEHDGGQGAGTGPGGRGAPGGSAGAVGGEETAAVVAERYRRVADGFGARLAGVRPEGWRESTPCTDWDVTALGTHVLTTHARVAGQAGGELAEIAPDADLLAEWERVRTAIAERLADPGVAAARVAGMFGEQSFASLVGRLLCADTLFHTWDLARATGQDEHLDEEACAAALSFLTPLDEAIRRPGGFAPKRPSPPGADVQRRLLDFGGRDVDAANPIHP